MALALAVFDRTSSAALTALVYALTFLPPLLTTSPLTGLADRYSRRDVMVVTDLVRAGLVGPVWLFGFFLALEALAAPFGHQIGVGPVVVGVLMAADLVGVAIGALVVARVAPARRERLVVPLAAATGVPLVVGALAPSLVSALLLWACCGAPASYMVLAKSLFTEAIPDGLRARTIGIASAGLQTSQGLGVLVAGGIAVVVPASVAIAASGVLGTAGAIAIALTTRDPARAVGRQPVPRGSR